MYASVMRGVLVKMISQMMNMKSLRVRKRTKAVTYSRSLCTVPVCETIVTITIMLQKTTFSFKLYNEG